MSIAHLVAEGFARIAEHLNDPRISDDLAKLGEDIITAGTVGTPPAVEAQPDPYGPEATPDTAGVPDQDTAQP